MTPMTAEPPLRTFSYTPAREQTISQQRAVLGDKPLPYAQCVTCPSCQKSFAPASVAEHAPACDAEDGTEHHKHLAFYCDHCDHVVYFTRAFLRDAVSIPKRIFHTPGGFRDVALRIVRTPRIVNSFLTRFPQCRGIID